MVRLSAERSDSKSNVKLGGFRSQLQGSYVSNHHEELWYNETVCLWRPLHTNVQVLDAQLEPTNNCSLRT